MRKEAFPPHFIPSALSSKSVMPDAESYLGRRSEQQPSAFLLSIPPPPWGRTRGKLRLEQDEGGTTAALPVPRGTTGQDASGLGRGQEARGPCAKGATSRPKPDEATFLPPCYGPIVFASLPFFPIHLVDFLHLFHFFGCCISLGVTHPWEMKHGRWTTGLGGRGRLPPADPDS